MAHYYILVNGKYIGCQVRASSCEEALSNAKAHYSHLGTVTVSRDTP